MGRITRLLTALMSCLTTQNVKLTKVEIGIVKQKLTSMLDIMESFKESK